MLKDEPRVRCATLVVKFRPGSNQGDQLIEASNVGSTTFLEVYRTDDELRVDYVDYRIIVPKSPLMGPTCEAPIVRKRISWNYATVFEYYCEKMWTSPSFPNSG